MCISVVYFNTCNLTQGTVFSIHPCPQNHHISLSFPELSLESHLAGQSLQTIEDIIRNHVHQELN